MNTALPEMLNCLRTATGAAIKGGEMSVLERQKLVLKWQQDQLLQPIQQQQQQQQQSSLNELSVLGLHDHSFMGLINGACVSGLNQVLNRPVKPDQGLEPGWSDGVTMDSYSGYSGLNYAISRTTSYPPAEVAAQEAGPPPAIARNGGCGRASFKKRKGEQSMNTEVEAEEERRAKKMKGSGEEEESKITEQNSNTNQTKKSTTCNKDHKNNNKEASSGCTSKDNYSKASEVQKPDYIHVRARRGQATDSHSLAERVRREKISERMKYLQELVPGCNKITGKAGMLDEIINYVQSLQRQVEFLSMKLATVNPRLDFSIDELLAKEVIEGCSASLPANPVGLSPEEIANPPYMHYNPLQQMGPLCGSEFGANPIDMGLRRAISASVSMPEGFFDASCFNQIPSSLPWDADLQNIFMMEFQQGRPSSFHSHAFTGPNDASSLKMEL